MKYFQTVFRSGVSFLILQEFNKKAPSQTQSMYGRFCIFCCLIIRQHKSATQAAMPWKTQSWVHHCILIYCTQYRPQRPMLLTFIL